MDVGGVVGVIVFVDREKEKKREFRPRKLPVAPPGGFQRDFHPPFRRSLSLSPGPPPRRARGITRPMGREAARLGWVGGQRHSPPERERRARTDFVCLFVWCVCPPQGNSGIFFFDAEFSTKRNDDDDDDRATAGDKKLK